MRDNVSVHLALYGVLSAAVVIATIVFRFPVPHSSLYGVNLGEAVIYITALLFGGLPAAIIGGVGSALADIVGGFPAWAPITFFVKGLEGLIVGYVYNKSGSTKDIFAVFCGAAVMVIGYTIFAGLIYGLGAVPVEFIGDIIQTAFSGIIAIPIARGLKKRM
ncbi:MAG TPA: ECF transporter S component [Thermoanaerobacterales bacterium]|nr:ECF transporter S component [Thermoanaerobacterales bacterium]